MPDMFPVMLTILTSNTCTAKCAHCTVYSSPERRGKLSVEQITRAVDDLYEQNGLQVVVFAGGEPTLLKEVLLDAIAHCDARGITTRVVTNASWATSDHAARKMVRKFREAGLSELNLSADDFHLPFISFDNIKRAWKAAKGQGFLNVAIANCAGPNSEITPDFIRRELNEPDIEVRFDGDGVQGRPMQHREDGSTYMLSNGLLQRIGRARETLKDEDLFFPASQAELDVGCQWAVRSAALAPSGHLVSCCGIEASGNEVLDFGDASAETATTLIKKANKDPLVRAISVVGPYRLLHLAYSLDRGKNIKIRERYASVCEACEDLVRQPAAVAILRGHEATVNREMNNRQSRNRTPD
jgi:MoaA/NifB/PqqE/SkfB family radical SAM enzyme